MTTKEKEGGTFSVGDLVTVKNMSANEKFCIIAFKTQENSGNQLAILKALFNDTYIIEKPITELNSLLIRGIL
jgi:hypothetical protein